jgi:hypothetical protein
MKISMLLLESLVVGCLWFLTQVVCELILRGARFIEW